MPSLAELIDTLQADLLHDPPRIAAYADLPFAVLCALLFLAARGIILGVKAARRS